MYARLDLPNFAVVHILPFFKARAAGLFRTARAEADRVGASITRWLSYSSTTLRSHEIVSSVSPCHIPKSFKSWSRVPRLKTVSFFSPCSTARPRLNRVCALSQPLCFPLNVLKTFPHWSPFGVLIIPKTVYTTRLDLGASFFRLVASHVLPNSRALQGAVANKELYGAGGNGQTCY